MKIVLSIFLILGLSSTFIFYVWGKMDVVRVGYELDLLSSQKIALEQEHDRLQLTYSQLTAPDRIAREASTKLSMRPPDPGQVILVSDDGRLEEKQHNNREPLRVAQRDVSMRMR